MAFPTTPVLDNFNAGAVQNLTARAGWGTSPFTTSESTAVTDGTPTFAGSTNIGGNNWDGGPWGAMECYLKFIGWTPSTNTFFLCARIQAFTASFTCYALELARVGSTDFELVKVVAGAVTVIGSNIATTVVNNDSIGIDCVGTTINTYYKSGAGAWSTKHSVTDSAITGTGKIGFRHSLTSNTNIDDFGGGSLDSAGEISGPRQQAVPFTRGAGGGGKI